MSKYVQISLFAIYILTTASCALVLLSFYNTHLSNCVAILLVAGWAGVCFSTIYITPDFILFRNMNVRKPILAEEQRLRGFLQELKDKAGIPTERPE